MFGTENIVDMIFEHKSGLRSGSCKFKFVICHLHFAICYLFLKNVAKILLVWMQICHVPSKISRALPASRLYKHSWILKRGDTRSMNHKIWQVNKYLTEWRDILLWLSCRCSRKLSMVEGRFSKWFLSVKKGVLNLFLSISMAYNVISCQKVAENTQILKIAKFAM